MKAFGAITSWKKNEMQVIAITMTISERMACNNEMPAALIAVNSELSPRLPNVISDDSRMASGKA